MRKDKQLDFSLQPGIDKNQISVLKGMKSYIKTLQAELLKAADIVPRVNKFIVGGHSDWVRDLVLTPDGNRLVTASDDHTARLWDMSTLSCLNVYAGHTSTVRSVAVSPGGELLATGSWDMLIKIWKLSEAICLRTLYGHTARIRSVNFSRDGRFLYSASEDNTARKWDVASGSCLLVFKGHNKSVRDITINRTGDTAFSSDEEGVILSWDTRTGKTLGRFGSPDKEIFTLHLSPDGDRLFSGGKDGVIRSWNTLDFRLTREYPGHRNWIMSISDGGKPERIVSADLDGITKIWDIRKSDCIVTHGGPTWVVNTVRFGEDYGSIIFASEHRAAVIDIETGMLLKDFGGHDKNVSAFYKTPHNKHFVTSSWDGITRLWDFETGACIKKLKHPKTEKRGIISLAVSQDEIFTGSDNGYIIAWSAKTGKSLRSFKLNTDNIHGICVTPDKSRIIVCLRELYDNLRLLDAKNGEQLKSYFGHINTVFSIDLSRDGRLLASGSADNTVKLWDADKGTCLKTFTGHSDWVECVRISPDSTVLLSGGCDSIVRMWDTTSGKLIGTLEGSRYSIYSLDISADNRYVIGSGSDKCIRLWDTRTEKIVREFSGNDYQLYRAISAKNGETILAGGKNTVRVWQASNSIDNRKLLSTGNSVCSMFVNSYTKEILLGCWEYGSKKIDLGSGTISKHYKSNMSTTYAVALSPSGERLVTGGRSVLTSLIDAKTGRQIRWFEHPDNVNALAFNANADSLFTACSDGIVRKWDVSSCICGLKLKAHDGPVNDIKVTRDESHVYSGGTDAILRKWALPTGVCIKTLAGHSDTINSIVLGWNEKILLSGSKDRTARLWDCERGNLIRTIDVGMEVSEVCLDLEGDNIYIGCDDGSIHVYDYAGVNSGILHGHTSRISGIEVLQESNLLISSSYDGTVCFRTYDSGALRATFHNLDYGFAWTSPPDDESEAGWLWTDRPETIHVVECDRGGTNPRTLKGKEKSRNEFVATHNSRHKILERLTSVILKEKPAIRKIGQWEPERKLLP
jgi:WD40 repeat protein